MRNVYDTGCLCTSYLWSSFLMKFSLQTESLLSCWKVSFQPALTLSTLHRMSSMSRRPIKFLTVEIHLDKGATMRNVRLSCSASWDQRLNGTSQVFFSGCLAGSEFKEVIKMWNQPAGCLMMLGPELWDPRLSSNQQPCYPSMSSFSVV